MSPGCIQEVEALIDKVVRGLESARAWSSNPDQLRRVKFTLLCWLVLQKIGGRVVGGGTDQEAWSLQPHG